MHFQRLITRFFLSIAIVLTCSRICHAQKGHISSVNTVFSLADPHGIFADAKGNVFVASTRTNRILKITPRGNTQVVAGSSAGGFNGDGGPAIRARLLYPRGIFVDPKGNIYIADAYNHRIRKVDSESGIITTIAGRRDQGFSGDGGPATLAQFAEPWDVFVDKSNNIYVADTGNDRIRKIDGQTGIITTVAGDGKVKAEVYGDKLGRGTFYGDGGPATEASIAHPMGIYVDEDNNLYIADTMNHRIRKLDASGIITTVAGDGTSSGITALRRDVGNWLTYFFGYVGAFTGEDVLATQASLSFPADICLDANGNLYIADRDNHRIRKIIAETGMIQTVVGDGWRHSETEHLNQEPGDFGYIYYKGHGENHGTYSSPNRTGRFEGDGQLALKASLNQPYSIHIDQLGNLYIADTHNQRIRKVEGIADVNVALAEGLSADFDSDGQVGFTDFLFFARQFGKTQSDTDFDARSDLNNDGAIDFSDFIAFASQFGQSP